LQDECAILPFATHVRFVEVVGQWREREDEQQREKQREECQWDNETEQNDGERRIRWRWAHREIIEGIIDRGD
jgi:hypothetical protein